MTYNIYWGDMHCNIRTHQMDMLDDIYDGVSKILDFFPVAYYPFYRFDHKGFNMETQDHEQMFDDQWEMIREYSKKYDKDGEFVTFMGYEWHGARTFYGDHNVFFYDHEQDLDPVKSLPKLYENLHKVKGIAIPHHTAYQVGQRGKNWKYFDEKISPFSEIFSNHGSSEGINTPFPLYMNYAMAPRTSGGTVQDGLERGHHFGVIGSGDSHDGFGGVWGSGLMAACSKDLTRESLWDAFLNRRVYAVTGDRIKLDYKVNGAFMGSVVDEPAESSQIEVAVEASDEIDRIEIIKNNRVLHTLCHQGQWEDKVPKTKVRFKQKIAFGWGPSLSNEYMEPVKRWIGDVEIYGGKILSVEPCFTTLGQDYNLESDTKCSWDLISSGFMRHKFRGQALIVEFEADSMDSIVKYNIENELIEREVRECLKESLLKAYIDESKDNVEKHLGLTNDEVINHDMYFHTAFKAIIHRAAPEPAYKLECKFEDVNLQEGENHYYVRVSQTNGQMAWSSPVWITKNTK